MRFIHISDTHVGSTPGYTLHSNPALPNLQALVDTINNLPFRPDFVLHNGDVVNDRQEASYVWRSRFSTGSSPGVLRCRDHDQPDLMQRILLGRRLP
jgi:3',5'-cyclic AMP phosphodiesterase CpdA